MSKKKRFSSSTELGELKLEYPRIKEAIIVKPKFYYLNTGDKEIFKSKGTGRIKNFNEFMKLLNDKIISSRHFTKLKESAVRKVPFSSIIQVTKKLGFEDNKRKWPRKFSWQEEQDSESLVL